MANMTLQHLHEIADRAIASFEEKIQTYTKDGSRRYLDAEMMIDYWEGKDRGNGEWYANPYHYELGHKAYIASKVYQIARTEGMDAALLYKLAHA